MRILVLLMFAVFVPSWIAQVPQTVVPYGEDFFGPGIGPEWEFLAGPNGGRVILSIGQNPSPISGGNALLMDSTMAGTLVQNEARLHVDMIQSGARYLLYQAASSNDAADPGEGVWLSDGVNEVLVQSHAGLSATWQGFEIDLVAAANQGGIGLGANFEIIFRHFSDAPLPSGGVLIDDLQLLPPDDSGQANSAEVRFEVNEGRNANGFRATEGRQGPFFASGRSLDLVVRGEPNQPWLLFFGPLGVNNALVPGYGSIDLGLLGAGNFSDVALLLDGNAPQNAIDFFAILGPTGESQLSFGLSSLPPGLLGSFQVLAYHSGPSVVALSAAFEFQVAP